MCKAEEIWVRLLKKMFNENVSSKLVKSIQSMYKSVKVAVKSNNETSPLFDSNIGVS